MYKGNRGFAPRGGDGGNFAPVKVGEELDVKIEAVGEKGDGIAKIKGFVLFVPNTKQGDEVKIRITKVLRKVGFAEVVEKGSASTQENSEEATSEEQVDTGSVEDTEDFGEDTEESEEEPQEE